MKKDSLGGKSSEDKNSVALGGKSSEHKNSVAYI